MDACASRSLCDHGTGGDESGGSVDLTRTTRLPLLALGAATLGLVAAVVVAAGPARGEHAEYSWPPATVPAGSPDRGFYAPLPLLNRVPSSLEIELPCSLAPPLRDVGLVTILATARRAQTAGALRITRLNDALRISVGADLASLPWPASCPLRVKVADGELRLPDRAIALETGALDEMPIVTGLFTTLDLQAAGKPPQVVVRTRNYATSWTGRQVVAGALAIVFVCAALILLARLRRSRPLGRVIRSAWAARDPTDAVVVGVLLVWWIVAPALFDDGWLAVQLRAFDDLGTVNFYYDTWGGRLPVGYWIEWLRHWPVGSTSDLVFMRLPTLAVLLAAWPLSRWCLKHVVPGPARASVRWMLAATFLVGATAWGMTLRLEPFMSLLTLAVLAAMISFALAPRPAPLAIAVLTAAFAVTAHPTGLVAAGPLLAGAPLAVGWLRRAGRETVVSVATLLVAGAALALVLFALDADLATRLSDSRVARDGNYHAVPWWREYIRYTTFDAWGGGTTIRRLSLALLVLSVVAWLTRRRAARTNVSWMPAASVALGLLLLAFLPSKWPWHLGALVAIGGLAAAAELARLVRECDYAGWRTIRPVSALVLVCVVAVWSWRAPSTSGLAYPLDLQETSWSSGFNVYSLLVPVLVVVLALAVWVRAGRRLGGLEDVIGPSAVIVSFAVVGLTAAVLVRDATITAWSPARQNLDALIGGSSCGLAHQLDGEGNVVDRLVDEPPVLLAQPVAVYVPCSRIPVLEEGLVQVPRLIVFQSTPFQPGEGDSPFAAIPDLYRLRTIADGPQNVGVLAVTEEIPGFLRVDAYRSDVDSRASTAGSPRAPG